MKYDMISILQQLLYKLKEPSVVVVDIVICT